MREQFALRVSAAKGLPIAVVVCFLLLSCLQKVRSLGTAKESNKLCQSNRRVVMHNSLLCF